MNSQAEVSDGFHASANVVVNAYGYLGIRHVLGNLRGFSILIMSYCWGRLHLLPRSCSIELKAWLVILLAEKVDSLERARMYTDMGFEMFQGDFFARPIIVSGSKIKSSRLFPRLLSL
ncbi:hypothetical protein ABO04_01940 [Nitrosomonas sp. HPC101]|uniref:hypothetical protein n=1 Tax=Nitrosomonas sp. HPC101 TaxID=1658667 RepID=UPI00136967FF|nr:hypothetical protein [Nitrosomonas sp. HPC101]MXS84704.1 hypothetical protein [Nitrosomonas sp. HPC101]